MREPSRYFLSLADRPTHSHSDYRALSSRWPTAFATARYCLNLLGIHFRNHPCALPLTPVFDELHFTGAFQHLDPTPEELTGHAARKAIMSHSPRTKASVVHQTQSLLLIDDSAENALDASRASPPVKVLLFGQYGWNRIILDPKQSDELDQATYAEWEAKGLMSEVEERRRKRIEEGWVPEHVERVDDWQGVVQFMDKWESDGRPALV